MFPPIIELLFYTNQGTLQNKRKPNMSKVLNPVIDYYLLSVLKGVILMIDFLNSANVHFNP